MTLRLFERPPDVRNDLVTSETSAVVVHLRRDDELVGAGSIDELRETARDSARRSDDGVTEHRIELHPIERGELALEVARRRRHLGRSSTPQIHERLLQ